MSVMVSYTLIGSHLIHSLRREKFLLGPAHFALLAVFPTV